MDRIKMAATVFALATFAETAFAQDGIIIDMWPKTGEWITVLTTVPNGDASCSTVTGPQKSGTMEKVSFGFTVSDGKTHFHLRLQGAEPMNLSSLQMEVSGSILIDMPLINRVDKDDAEVMEAEIPGNRFASVVRPSLAKGRQVTVRAGTKTYVLPHEQFSKAVDNLSACIERARQRNAGRPQ